MQIIAYIITGMIVLIVLIMAYKEHKYMKNNPEEYYTK